MASNRLAAYWTLARLAADLGCSTAALRQRIERGTLSATKVGSAWVVAPAEAERVLERRRIEREQASA